MHRIKKTKQAWSIFTGFVLTNNSLKHLILYCSIKYFKQYTSALQESKSQCNAEKTENECFPIFVKFCQEPILSFNSFAIQSLPWCKKKQKTL